MGWNSEDSSWTFDLNQRSEVCVTNVLVSLQAEVSFGCNIGVHSTAPTSSSVQATKMGNQPKGTQRQSFWFKRAWRTETFY